MNSPYSFPSPSWTSLFLPPVLSPVIPKPQPEAGSSADFEPQARPLRADLTLPARLRRFIRISPFEILPERGPQSVFIATQLRRNPFPRNN